MDLSSINLYNPFLKPFLLLASTTSHGNEFQILIVDCVKKYFLSFVLNLLPDHFIGCPQLCHKKYWLTISYSRCPQQPQFYKPLSPHSSIPTLTHPFYLVSALLFVALQYSLWKPNSMQYFWHRHILHASSSTTEVFHSLLLLLFLFCHFLHS